MAHESVQWVFKNSPYKGADFIIHLAIADYVNDKHGWALYASQQSIADKARVGRAKVNRTMKQMVEDGLLIDTGEYEGRTKRYIFVMQTPQEAVLPLDVPVEDSDVSTEHTEVSPTNTSSSIPEIHKQEVEQEVEQTLAAAAPPRKRDHLFEALATNTGLDWKKLTSSERGRLNKACKELRDVGATPSDVEDRARRYRKKWPDMELTPTALASNWSQLAPDERQLTLTEVCDKCSQYLANHTDWLCEQLQEMP